MDGEIKLAVSHGIRSPETLLSNDHLRRVLRTEERSVVQLPEDIAIEGVLTDFRPREVLIEPILYKHIILGVIILAKAVEFSEEDLNRLNHFRQGLSMALQNALIHDRLQRLAALDPLTSIYNRRFGMTRLHDEFGRAIRTNIPLGIMMFDIDHFKSVNDAYGHLVGDHVLVRITKLARSVLREGDVLIRYGGEEFLAVLPAASKDDVQKVAERLRRTVAENNFEDGNQKIQITISLGGCSYPEIDVENEIDLIKSVDEALYVSKETGRNKVTIV